MAGRRHDSVRAEPIRSAVSRAGDRWSANRRHTTRELDRTIIEGRSSFRTGNTSSITPEGTASPWGARGSPRWHGEQAAPRRGRRRRLYAPSGHLLFARQGELLAHSFDATRLVLDGEAFPVADNVSVNPGISLASLSASASGPIAYGTDSIRRTQFAWFDRSGRRLRDPWYTGSEKHGQSFAVARRQSDRFQPRRRRELGHLGDRHARRRKQVTSALSLDFNPVWSSDGRQIFYQSKNCKHLLTIDYRRHARAGLAERADNGLPVGGVAGRKRTPLHPGHGSVG